MSVNTFLNNEIGQTILNAAMDGFCIVGLDGKIYSANPAFCNMTGYSQEELLKIQIKDIDLNWSPEKVELYTRDVTQKETIRFETKVRRKDQEIRHVEVSGHLHKSNAGESLLFCFVRDITEDKWAVEALRTSEARYRYLYDHMIDAFGSVDMSGKIKEYNQAFLNMLGYKAEEITELTYMDITPEKWHARDADIVEKQISRRGYSDVFEKEFRRKNGEVFPVELRVVLIKDHAGKSSGMWAIVRDISERKRAEKSLRESELKYRSLFNSMVEGFALHEIICDKHGNPCDYRFLDVNPAFEQLTGFKRGDVIGKTVLELLPKTEPQWIKAYGEVALTGQSARFERYSASLGKHYEVFAYRAAPRQFAVLFVDITARKQVEKSLRESEKKYRRLFETLTDAFLIFDATTGLFVEANEAARKLYGYTREEFLKLHHLAITAEPEESAITYQRILRGEIGKVPLRYHKRKDGTTFPTDIMTSTILIDGHTLVYGIIRDISDRMHVETTLRESEEKFRLLFETITDACLILDDATGLFVDINEAALKLYGYTKEEFLKLHPLDITAEPNETSAAIEQVIKGSVGRVPLRWHKKKDGTVFAVDLMCNTIVVGGRTLMYVISRDITELKRHIDELAAREKTLATLLDLFPSYTMLVDKDSIILAVNDAMCGRMQKKREEVLGTRFTNYFDSETVCRRWQLYKKVIVSGTPVYFEDERIGQIFSHSAFPVFGGDGKVTAVAVFAEDITERKHAEQELLAREKTLRTLMDSFPYHTVLIDKNNIILAINDAMCRYRGKSRDELIGTDIGINNPPPNYERYLNFRKKVMASGEPLHYEDECEGVSSSTSVFPVFGADGKVASVAVFSRHITEEKRAQQELIGQKKTISTLLDSFPYQTILIDEKDIILALNQAMCLRLGKSRDELIGTNLSNYFSPDVYRRRLSYRKNVFKSGKPVHYEDEDNGRLSAVSVFPVFSGEGKVISVAAFVKDITSERHNEDELRNYRKKMAGAEKLATIGTMSAMIAHQLNQPLTIIRLLIQDAAMSLKSGESTESVTTRIDETLSEVTKASTIIKNLLNWSRLPADHSRQSVNLVQIADNIIHFLSESARRAEVQLLLNDDLKEIPALTGNPMDFEQLFFILMENAIHAAEGKKDRVMQISGQLENDEVKLKFSDNCGGIEPENIDKIFEPFFTTKIADKGTGLGLPIAKQIVENYGGSIGVESRLGYGTTFNIRLPLTMLR